MDSDGYPTEAELKAIREWPLADTEGLFQWLEQNWYFGDWGFSREGDKLELHTGGWSGNEEIIGALQENYLFWVYYWRKSERGGHYYFERLPNSGGG